MFGASLIIRFTKLPPFSSYRQRTQYRLYIKARESGQKIPGSSGMNDERIRQLEDLGFVWALRGQEGSRREDGMLQDTDNVPPSATVMTPEDMALSPDGSTILPAGDVMESNESLPVAESTFAHSHPDPQSQHHHHDDHHAEHHHNHQPPEDPEAILEEPSVMAAYHNVQEV